MNRLTRYDRGNRYYEPSNYEIDKQSTILKLCKKLGQYEDIEEQLGIDLITLFNGLLNGIYYKDENDIIKFDKVTGYQVQLSQIRENMNLYGKTWALTKEELL